MLVKYLTILCIAIALVGFFASRPAVTLSQQTDYKTLLSQLRNKPLTDSQIKELVKSGEPTLDVVLDDFMGSDFVIELRKQIKKGFNLGQAIDKNVHASNVIRVVEAFGTAGVERLIKRLPPHVVKIYRFDSPEYRRLGIVTVKPLLTTEIFSKASKDDLPRLIDWARTYVDLNKVREVAVKEGIPEVDYVTDIGGPILTGNGRAVEPTRAKLFWSREFLRDEVDNKTISSFLSPRARRRLTLEPLDAPTKIKQ